MGSREDLARARRELDDGDEMTRNRGYKTAVAFLKACHEQEPDPATQTEQFRNLWTGLWQYLWGADKRGYQDRCAERMAQTMHFPKGEMNKLRYLDAMFHVCHSRWDRLDKYRVDKFLYFMRNVVRESFKLLAKLTEEGEGGPEYSSTVNGFRRLILKELKLTDGYQAPTEVPAQIIDVWLAEIKESKAPRIVAGDAVAIMMEAAIICQNPTVIQKLDDVVFHPEIFKEAELDFDPERVIAHAVRVENECGPERAEMLHMILDMCVEPTEEEARLFDRAVRKMIVRSAEKDLEKLKSLKRLRKKLSRRQKEKKKESKMLLRQRMSKRPRKTKLGLQGDKKAYFTPIEAADLTDI